MRNNTNTFWLATLQFTNELIQRGRTMSRSSVTMLCLCLIGISHVDAADLSNAIRLTTSVLQQDKPGNSEKTNSENAGEGKESSSKIEATSADSESLKKLIDRINKLEAEVDRLKKGQIGNGQAGGKDGQILTMVDIAHVGTVYAGNGQSRYAAIHLMIANTTDKPINLTRENIEAEIDGESRKLDTIPSSIVNYSFQFGRQAYMLNTMQPAKNWKVPAGGQTSFWLVYPGLTVGNAVPKCKLKLTIGDTVREVDVNASQRGILALETERIGPRGSLALLTINGSMTPFNCQSLVDELETLIAAKVVRAVVRWGEGAPQPDGNIQNWLTQSTMTLGQVRNPNEQFPAIPSSLREFHLVKFADADNSNDPFGYRANNAPQRIHKTAAEAIGSALRTAYLALPRDELLQEIREGHPLTRAAALAFGGGRLDAEHLPQIFQWIEDKDPEIQKAAMQCLSHFGEAEAVAKLVHYAKRNVEPLSSSAIESLAGSRFGSAHEALLELLKNEPPESKKRLVQVLARYPRPIWSETIFEFVTDSRSGLHLEALKALVQVGHPKLVDVLETALKSNDLPLKDFAFQTLAQRNDERSEKIAIDFTLAKLKESPPDPTMIQLLTRTKDQRALPLLQARLADGKSSDRTSVLNLLVQIGDRQTIDGLVEKYASFNTNEKTQVLNGLRLFKHPKFRELAGAALLTNDSSLVSTAANALQLEGSPESEKLIIDALEKQTAGNQVHYLTNALALFGTPTARSALLKAKESPDNNKKNYATNALQQMKQRSPGYQAYIQAMGRLQSPVDRNDKNAKSALEKEVIELFTQAIQLEPDFPEAHAGRGKMYLRQNKLEEAGKDFEKAIELKLEQEDSEVTTGLALSRVVAGRLDDAIKLIEDNRAKHTKTQKDGLYEYNCACVYSRAVQHLNENEKAADRDKKREEYKKKSLVDLEASIKSGFDDFDWMAEDPDFAAIREDAQFKSLLAKKPATKSKPEKPKGEE